MTTRDRRWENVSAFWMHDFGDHDPETGTSFPPGSYLTLEVRYGGMTFYQRQHFPLEYTEPDKSDDIKFFLKHAVSAIDRAMTRLASIEVEVKIPRSGLISYQDYKPLVEENLRRSWEERIIGIGLDSASRIPLEIHLSELDFLYDTIAIRCRWDQGAK